MPTDDAAPRSRDDAPTTDHRTTAGRPESWGPDPDPAAFERPGDVIGPYRLVSRLGEGGFGSVYLAEQTHPVRRDVALKIIKVGMDTRDVIARFEAERQALAMMEHPNVARILGAGATDRGRPYFVMDLVRGEPITDYCDAHSLSTRQRLILFLQVCDAVQHAHLKGIIHRDLKPSNVLVADIDGSPVPRVIDFGIAKATGGGDAERTIFTQSGQVIGTPEYMSPEQAGGRGADVDTRSDVYSLGVLLYELLTGATPFDSQRLRSAGYAEILRIIREEDPPRPSTRLSTLGTSAAAIAAQRATDVSRLRSTFRGDLDWIIMRALEKDRDRRYSAASALAADIARYLRDEPVTARPPSGVYRARKFVRRHRVGVSAACLVLVAILAGTGLSVAGFIQASRQRDLAVAAEARAVAEAGRATLAEASTRAEAQTATQVSDFLVRMLQGAGPDVALGRDTTLLREILDKTARSADTELADQPAVAPRILRILSAVYNDLAVVDKAEALARRAVEVARTLPRERDAAVARAQFDLAKALESAGKYDESIATYKESFEGYKAAGLEESEDAASAFGGSGGVYYRVNRYDEAEANFREALERRRRLAGAGDTASLASAMDRLSLILTTKPETFEEGARLSREALAMRRRLYGDVHPDIALSLANLAGVLSRTGDHQSAVETSLQAVEQHIKVYGERHPRTASARHLYSGNLEAAGRLREAAEQDGLALAIYLEALGPDHRNTLDARFTYGTLLSKTGDHGGAEQQFRAMVDYARAKYPPGDLRTCAVISLVTDELRAQKRDADAEPLLREALDGRIKNRPAGHPQINSSRAALADCLVAQRKFTEAEPLLLAVEKTTLAPETKPAARAAALKRMAEFYTAWNSAQPDEAHASAAERWKAASAAATPPAQ